MRVVVFDLETTGLSPRRGGRIVEIGAVALEDGRETAEFQSLVDPEVPIPFWVQKIHHISNRMVAGQPVAAEILPRFLEFVGSDPLVAHNAAFDIPFLRAELARTGHRDLPNRHLCTLKMSRKLNRGFPNHRLDTVAELLLGGIPEDCQRHRALDDARLAARIWLKMMEAEAANGALPFEA